MNSVRITIFLLVMSLAFGCKKEAKVEIKPTLAQIITKDYSNSVNLYFWQITAEILDSGNTKVLEKGVCFSEYPNPTISANKIENKDSKLTFWVNLSYSVDKNEISPLTINKKYYCRPYVTNSIGTSYGAEVSFFTDYSIELGRVYKGGVVVYLAKVGDPRYDPNIPHGLIAAPPNQSDKYTAPWGCTGLDIPDTGYGSLNTKAIVKTCKDVNSAAMFCDTFTYNGFTDWYLPDKNEINELNKNKGPLKYSLKNNYWSSSQSDINNAYQLNLYGGINRVSKSSTLYVIPFRSF